MKKMAIGLACVWGSAVLPLDARGAAYRDLRVTDAIGTVTVGTAEHPKRARGVVEETPLMDNDVIVTGPHSSAELTLDADTVFKLQADSRLEIHKLFSTNTQWQLTQGKLLGRINPAYQSERNMILKLPTAVVAIRGTELGAEARRGLSHVCVFDEGRVVVRGSWGNEHVILEPNQETRVTLSNVPQPPTKLVRFKAYRHQMSRLRDRAAFWHRHWKPLSVQEKQRIRGRLASPKRGGSTEFRSSVKTLSAPAVTRKPSPKTKSRQAPKTKKAVR